MWESGKNLQEGCCLGWTVKSTGRKNAERSGFQVKDNERQGCSKNKKSLFIQCTLETGYIK